MDSLIGVRSSSLHLPVAPSQLAQPYNMDFGLTDVFLQPDHPTPAWAAHTGELTSSGGNAAITSDGRSEAADDGLRSQLFAIHFSREAVETWQLHLNQKSAPFSRNETETSS
ncbi:hypothetical protein CCHR01_02202 [Colletotrichum chrysophilum]|uniref:Uncharacterized protein n=1 Tax=Colletotrichum chrysophilum TaxID=1836956 RepID=A0AAD9AXP4_9PEZI|nr:hypothetical protein CCHR01_02202 [Colletotrichum chrysophilum]